jgi:hypothetical protein
LAVIQLFSCDLAVIQQPLWMVAAAMIRRWIAALLQCIGAIAAEVVVGTTGG